MKWWALIAAIVTPGFVQAMHEVELRTDAASCRVDLDGGRIVSYVVGGEEQLWMPEVPQVAPGWRHGGIPICWPWFGVNARGEVHGTAWQRTFELSGKTLSSEESSADLMLREGDLTFRYRVLLTDSLRLEAEVSNDGSKDASYTIGFHPYFRVSSRDNCVVEGLDGLSFEDDPSFPNGTNGFWRGNVRTTNRIDRIYATTGTVQTCVLRECGATSRQLVFEGFTDINVWNPETDPEFDGILPVGAWRNFLCVEPVRFGSGDEVSLLPGERRRHAFTISPMRETLPTFVIELFEGKTGTVTVASSEMRLATQKYENGCIRLEWKGHPLLGDDFKAVAEGVRSGSGITWSFSCSGNVSGLPLGRIAFPVVDVPCAARGQLLYSPHAGGGTMGWKKSIRWDDLPPGRTVCSTMSPGFRFVAILNGKGQDSYYVDVRDPLSNSGMFEVGKGPHGTARVAWIHDMPLTSGNATSCRLPYVATVRPYRGDWFEAASFYREWVRTTPRYAAAKSRDMSKLRDIGLWMWNRGLADTVIPPVERFQSDTGLKAALDWYWWFKEMPGTFYPDYWPPREGADKFKADVRRLKATGAFTQVYLNGMTWDEDAPSWKDGGRDSVAMRRDGSYVSIAYNRFNPNHHLANLCGEAPKFHARIGEQIAHLVDCGFDSVYLDMIGCNAYGPCFNPAHRHAPGGGTHMTDDFRAFLKGIKKLHPGVLLSTEDCGEAYVDVVDVNISTHSSYERHGWIGTAPDVEFVPVFQALYHGAVAVFGNYAIVDNVPYWDSRWPMKAWWSEHEEHLRNDFPDQFAVEFCRGPAWGLQPSVHNFWIHHATNQVYSAEYRFICDTAKFYHDHRDFLFDGEMRHPGRLACARRRVAFAKVSVFDEKVESHESELPVVFHNVWRAPDGRIAAVLVNWSREPQRWKLNAPDVSGEGVLRPRSWALVPSSPVPPAFVVESRDVTIGSAGIGLSYGGESVDMGSFSRPDEWEVANYERRLEIVRKHENGGMLEINPSSNAVDTAWNACSTRRGLPEDARFFRFSVEADSTIDLYDTAGRNQWSSSVVWFGAKGDELGVSPLHLVFSKGRWTEVSSEGSIHEGAREFSVRIGSNKPCINRMGKRLRLRNPRFTVSNARAYARRGAFVSDVRAGGKVEWSARCPQGTAVMFQYRGGKSAEDLAKAAFVGPDGSSGSFFTESFEAASPLVQYRVLMTSDGQFSPFLASVTCGDRRDGSWTRLRDSTPPSVEVVSPLAGDPADSPFRLRISDDSAVCWSELQCSVDGRDVNSALRRQDDVVSLAAPAGGWTNGLHCAEISVSDFHGNLVKTKRFFFIGVRPPVPKVALRDDGMALVDGEPFFPIGIYDVCSRNFNGNNLDNAFRDLKAAGFNFAHTYGNSYLPQFLSSAKKYDMKLWVRLREPTGDFIRKGLACREVLAWYLGDDTSLIQTPEELLGHHCNAKAIDPNRLTAQADWIHGERAVDCYAAYVSGTDVFMPEIYPLRDELGAKMHAGCVAQTIRDMRRCRADIEAARARGDDCRHALWPILQYFSGWGGWKEFPTRDELFATTFAAIAEGANGIVWYTYGGMAGDNPRCWNFGVTSTPERWRTICELAGRIRELTPFLVSRTPFGQPTVMIEKGPKMALYGQPAVCSILKRLNDETLIVAVNAVQEPLKVRFSGEIPLDGRADVLWEGRSCHVANATFTDDFGPFAVHVYRIRSGGVGN